MSQLEKSCPRCREKLKHFKVFGVDLDQCPSCHGLWLDFLELERIKVNMDEDIRWKEFDLWSYAERAKFKTTKLACPSCASALCELLFDTSKIELEFCAQCGGVWADRGKLVPVINHLRKTVAQEPLAEMEKETLHQFIEIFTGRKGSWEEIKDFLAAWRLMSLKFMVEHPALAERLEIARRSLPF